MGGRGHLGRGASISLPRLSRNPITCFAICCLPAHINVCFSPPPRNGLNFLKCLKSGERGGPCFLLEIILGLMLTILGSLGKVDWRVEGSCISCRGFASLLLHSPVAPTTIAPDLITKHLHQVQDPKLTNNVGWKKGFQPVLSQKEFLCRKNLWVSKAFLKATISFWYKLNNDDEISLGQQSSHGNSSVL